jgi:CRP/FNR family cyclic AMP-dependent transcriptional regulator
MLKRKRGESSATPLPPIGNTELNYLELSFAKVPIFSACSTEELLRVAKVCTFRDAAPGESIVVEGGAGTEFYVILRGEAIVTRGGVEVGRVGPGDFFGELALFDPAPRNATVTAHDAMSIAVLTKPAFRRVLEEAPIRDNVFLGMARRLHQLDGQL